MVKNEIKIDDVVVSYELIADEGKLLYLSYELEEFGKEAMGVPNISVPHNYDLNNITEK